MTNQTAVIPELFEPIPGRVLIVDNRHTAASDTNAGDAAAPFRTIGEAARRALPGDEVRVQPGVYREHVAPVTGGSAEQPIRYVAARPGEVVVKGSEILRTEWRKLPGDGEVYAARIPDALVGAGSNPFLRQIIIAPPESVRQPARPVDEAGRVWPLTLAQFFVNGAPYRQLEEAELVKRFPRTWIVGADGRSLIAHFAAGELPPELPIVEVSVRERIFAPARRGLGFIQVQGFIFEHCANPGPFPQGGAVSTCSGHHWRIEENVIRHAQTIGLDCGNECWTFPETETGSHLIARNIVADNGLCGIAGHGHRDTVILNNVIERNNCLDINPSRCEWEEYGGIKLHGCDGVRIEGNLVRDNEAFGIWLDNHWPNVRITRNVVLNNRKAGIFFELGSGPALVDNNIIAHTRSGGAYYEGMGIYAHDSGGITVAHNLILGNAGCGVTMRTTGANRVEAGGKELASTSHERVVNNVIVENGGAAINLPFPNARAEDNVSDGNLLMGAREFWHGLNDWLGLMAVNAFVNSASNEQILQALADRLRAAGIAEDEWPNRKFWMKNPVLSLNQWRAMMGNDCGSVESAGGLACHLRPRELVLEAKAGEDLWRVICRPVPGVGEDFFGQAMPGQKPLPGPFQSLVQGENRLVLDPV